MKQNTSRLKAFFNNDSGSTAVEYGLLLALLAVAILGAVGALSQSNSENFNSVSDSYPT